MIKSLIVFFTCLISNHLYSGVDSDFFRSCLNGDKQKVYDLFCSHGKKLIYLKDKDENTCLHLACCSKKGGLKTEIAQFLISNHADINAQNRYESTPLIIAVTNSNYELVELLLQVENINPNLQDIKKYSALQHALLLHSPQMVKLILSHPKTNPNFGTSDGATPLHFASMWGYKEEAQILINDSRTDINAAQHDAVYEGATPLHFSALQAQYEIVKMLIDRGDVNIHASISKGIYAGFTPLHFAVMNPEPVRAHETVQYLLENGSDPKIQSELGKTPKDLTEVGLIKKLLQKKKQKKS